MEKLKLPAAEQLFIMERFRLTADEFLIIELLFLAFDGEPDCLYRYHSLSVDKPDLLNALKSLQDKGVILKSCKLPKPGETLDVETLEFNEIFLKNYRKMSGELGQELFNVYPNEAIINGQSVPLRNYAKKYKDEGEFYFNYGKAIGWSVNKHKEVLDLIKWSKDNDRFGLNMNIGDFVGSRMWVSIKDHKDGSSAITFDTITSV